jgi:thiamine-phosphate pyrophosphorylase
VDAAARDHILRILDANTNRLREALRVVEEYFRFVSSDAALSVDLKSMRHLLQTFEDGLDRRELLRCRDTQADPFASVNRPEELTRASVEDVAWASLKRAQEAARVMEEYVKVMDRPDLSNAAKDTRFRLYAFEKHLMEHSSDG